MQHNLDILAIIMNTKILLVPIFSLIFWGNLAAQDFVVSDEIVVNNQVETTNQGAFKTTFKKNDFRDNWTISIGSGAQVLFGEDDSKAKFTSRMTYAPMVSISKYFSPIWGLRMSFSGGSLHGFNDGRDGTYRKWNTGQATNQGTGFAGQPGYPSSTGPHFYTWDPSWTYRGWGTGTDVNGKTWKGVTPDGGSWYWNPQEAGRPQGSNPLDELYMQHVRYFSANINFMFDLRTLFGKYDPKRGFELTPYAGIAYHHIFPHMGYDAYDVAGVNAGLIAKFRLTNKVGLFAEFSGTMMPDDYDGHIGDNTSFDAIGQALAGISFNLGKSTWDVAEPMNYELINDLMNKINDLQVIASTPCPDCPPCPEVEPIVIEAKNESTYFLPDPVFFRIDKSIIDNAEWAKIEKAANYLNQYPEAKVVVTGYADKKTAYPTYNMKLSERRSKVVAKALTTKYGINPSRISIDWEGDKIQPFDINEWNRVVIFVIQ